MDNELYDNMVMKINKAYERVYDAHHRIRNQTTRGKHNEIRRFYTEKKDWDRVEAMLSENSKVCNEILGTLEQITQVLSGDILDAELKIIDDVILYADLVSNYNFVYHDPILKTMNFILKVAKEYEPEALKRVNTYYTREFKRIGREMELNQGPNVNILWEIANIDKKYGMIKRFKKRIKN